MLWMVAECCCQISRHAGQGTGLFADADLDLAAIKVDAPTPFYATFDSSSLRLGEPLVALGTLLEFVWQRPKRFRGKTYKHRTGKHSNQRPRISACFYTIGKRQ